MISTDEQAGASSTPASIDLNSDLGEGFGAWTMGDDDALLSIVTSANIACGFHAGDPMIMRRTCAEAVERGVQIGAHVAYRDLAGFGRRGMDIDAEELSNDVIYQIGALSAFATAAGGRVSYVKPHGGLYNRIARDESQARAVVAAIERFDPSLVLLGLAGSVVLDVAQQSGVTAVPEAFADRAYDEQAQLVSRKLPGAVIQDPATASARAVRMAIDGTVESTSGTSVAVRPRSLCVHGDTPGAVELARRVRSELEGAGVRLSPFT